MVQRIDTDANHAVWSRNVGATTNLVKVVRDLEGSSLGPQNMGPSRTPRHLKMGFFGHFLGRGVRFYIVLADFF